MTINETFSCPCGGPVKTTASPDLIFHACAERYAPGTSYFDGMERFIPYQRSGVDRYQWFVKWLSTKEDCDAVRAMMPA